MQHSLRNSKLMRSEFSDRNFKSPKSEFFDIDNIMRDDLGIHSLTDHTYKEQQILEEAVNRCTYKGQSLDYYENVNINSIGMEARFDAVGSDADVYNDDESCATEYRCTYQDQSPKWYNCKDVNAVEVESYFDNGEFIPDDESTIKTSNLSSVNWLEDPYEYKMYDGIRAQMDGGAKCTVTNKLELLHDRRFYNKFFPPKVRMKGATSEKTIVPVAEGYLKVPTINEGVFMKIKCYYSR